MNLDIIDFAVIISAVIFGNAFSFAFFYAAMKISRFEKENGTEADAPLWVYAALAITPLMAATGAILLS